MKYLRNGSVLLVLLALALTSVSSSGSEEVTQQLKEARQIFLSSLEKIDVDFLDMVDKCRTSYAVSLNQAEGAATKQGDLDGVLKIRKEKVRFAADRAVDDEIKPDTHPVIKQVVETYLKNLEAADVSRGQQAGILARKYIQHLDALKKRLTTESKIEDALIVHKEIEKTASDPSISEALSHEPASASGGAIPCPTCSGDGKAKTGCPDCDSSGTCAYCEGSGVRKGLGGKGVPCFACTGSKKCKKCNGVGQLITTCPTCRGSGQSR